MTLRNSASPTPVGTSSGTRRRQLWRNTARIAVFRCPIRLQPLRRIGPVHWRAPVQVESGASATWGRIGWCAAGSIILRAASRRAVYLVRSSADKIQGHSRPIRAQAVRRLGGCLSDAAGLFFVSESDRSARARLSVLLLFSRGAAGPRSRAARRWRSEVLDRTNGGTTRELWSPADTARGGADSC